MGHLHRHRHVARAAVGLGAAALFLLPLPVRASSVPVSVNGHPIDLPGAVTVQEAAIVAGITPRIGVMRSVGTGDPLSNGARPPRITRDGQPASATSVVGSGDRILIQNGEDYVEPIDTVIEPIAAPGFPSTESQIWQAGQPGQLAHRVGRYSGQAGGDQVVEAPIPPSPDVGPRVALSFDDGPDARWTPRVLDILKAQNVKAVFCLVGKQMQRFPDLVKRIHAEGHALCDHSQNHDMAASHKSDAYNRVQVDEPYNLIKSLTGEPPRFYRGPGGDLSVFIIAEAHRLGMRVLTWSVDPGDYHRPGAATIQNRIALSIKGGGVALMHDGGGDRSQTVAQLPGLIDRLRSEGYSIVVP